MLKHGPNTAWWSRSSTRSRRVPEQFPLSIRVQPVAHRHGLGRHGVVADEDLVGEGFFVAVADGEGGGNGLDVERGEGFGREAALIEWRDGTVIDSVCEIDLT